MVIEELYAQSDHLPKSALILVVKVFLLAVEVITKDCDQVAVVEVLVVVLVFFVEVTEHLRQSTLPLPRP